MKEIKILDPLFKAWDDMLAALFKPFDLSKWLILGFTAWLAFLGEGWGGNWNCNFNTPFKNIIKEHKIQTKGCNILNSFSQSIQAPCCTKNNMPAYLNKIKNFFASTSIIIIIAIGALAVLTGIIIALLSLWIKSRGEFMFIDNLINRRSEISLPWREYKSHGNSLFIGQITISLIVLFFFFVIFGFGAAVSYSWIADCIYMRKFLPPSRFVIAGLAVFILIFLIFALISTVVSFLIKQFVIPLMYFKNFLFYEACITSLNIIRTNILIIAGYIGIWFLLNILIATGVLLLNLTIGLCTCCIGLFILSLPYLWAVFYLPLLAFMRFFSINFVAQFNPVPESSSEAASENYTA